jgi:hypothetical protein
LVSIGIEPAICGAMVDSRPPFHPGAPIRAIPALATVLSPSEVAEPVLNPLNHLRQAGEYIDDAQDDDSVTDSNPETVKVV